jgi:hypothetical protein
MIEHTKKLVEDKFTTLGGYEHNAEVKYQRLALELKQFVFCLLRFLLDITKFRLLVFAHFTYDTFMHNLDVCCIVMPLKVHNICLRIVTHHISVVESFFITIHFF